MAPGPKVTKPISALHEVVEGDNLFNIAERILPTLRAKGVPDLTNKEAQELINLIRSLHPSEILIKKAKELPGGSAFDTLFRGDDQGGKGEVLPLSVFTEMHAKKFAAFIKGLRKQRALDAADAAKEALEDLDAPKISDKVKEKVRSEVSPKPTQLPPPAKKASNPHPKPTPTQKAAPQTAAGATKCPPSPVKRRYIEMGVYRTICEKVRDSLPKGLQKYLPSLDKCETQVAVESSKNIYAKNPVSSARGLTQVVSRTARSYWSNHPPLPNEIRELANQYAKSGLGPEITGHKFQTNYLNNPVIATWLQQKILSTLKHKYETKGKLSPKGAEFHAFLAYYAGEPAIDEALGIMKPDEIKKLKTTAAQREQWRNDAKDKYSKKLGFKDT